MADWVDGLAFWPFIFIKPNTSAGLLAHEKVHIRQQVRGLLIFFYIRYYYYQWKYGYKDNPFEVEARKISGH